MRGVLFVAVMALAGCGSEKAQSSAAPDASAADTAPPFDAGPCGVAIRKMPSAAAAHVEDDASLDAASNPPAGGDHYGRWVEWGAHETPIPAGHWLHNLEHGGVAFLYRCASRAACPSVAARLEELAARLPQDPLCVPPLRARVLVLPDPDLPVGTEIAAVAWEWVLTAKCTDEAALRDFYSAHFGRAPENVCAEGSIAARDAASD